ncbi:MAG: helix-turn-helix domain-containing protein [Lachnospiraceae bacterium]|nr:helix-turn-helix domain-containing protein [Lachnospiraceae bacterium]
MENKEQFGKLIIWLRERDGLSQKELAEKLYVVPSAVCKWEKGRSVPDREKLKLISELFQIPYEDLLDPETTLLKIKSVPVMSQLEQKPKLEQESKHEQEPKPKRKRYRWICIAAVVIIVIISTVGVISDAHNQSDEWMILDTYEQYIDDPGYGTVYEIIYAVNIYPDTEVTREFEEDQVLTYVQQLELETDIVKVSYYDNEAVLKAGEDPGRCSYYFINNYEDD